MFLYLKPTAAELPDRTETIRHQIFSRDVTSPDQEDFAGLGGFQAATDFLPDSPVQGGDCDAFEDDVVLLQPAALPQAVPAPHVRILSRAKQIFHGGWDSATRLAEKAFFAVVPELRPRGLNLTTEMIAALVPPWVPDDVDDFDPEAQVRQALFEMDARDAVNLPPPRIELPEVHYVYSARDKVNFNNNPGTVFMDRVRMGAPGELRQDPESEITLVTAEWGKEFEKEVWAEIVSEYRQKGCEDAVVEIPSGADSRGTQGYWQKMQSCFELTLQAMRAGKDVIAQGVLIVPAGERAHFLGITDLLIKVPNKPGEVSSFGDGIVRDYHYEVRDMKLSSDPASHKLKDYIIQLLDYAHLLQKIQGVRPANISILKGNREILTYETEKFFDWYETLSADFMRFLKVHDPEDFARGLSDVSETVETLIRRYRAELDKAGLLSLHDIAYASIEVVDGIPDDVFKKIKRKARLQAVLAEMPLDGRYKSTSKRERRRYDSLAQVAGSMRLHRDALRAVRSADIYTLRELADTKLEKIDGIPEVSFARLKRRAQLQVASRGRLEDMELNADEKALLKRVGVHYIKDLAEVERFDKHHRDDSLFMELKTEVMANFVRQGGFGDLVLIPSHVDILHRPYLYLPEDVAERENIEKAAEDIVLKLIQRAKTAAEKFKLERPKYEVLPIDRDKPSSGLAALPPLSKNDIIADFEGFIRRKGSLEYLLGCITVDYSTNPKGEIKFREFWAHDDDQERKNFEMLIDWWHTTWKNDPTMHVYHYAAYEATALKRMAAKYSTRQKELDELLDNKVLVDVYRIVDQGLLVGAESDSIKHLEALWMGKRKGEVSTAVGSIGAYDKWQQSKNTKNPEGDLPESSPTLASIRDYNYLDVLSLLKGIEWLRKVQKEKGIAYVDPVAWERAEQDRLAELRRKWDEERIKSRRGMTQVEFRGRIDRATASMQALMRDKIMTADEREAVQFLTDLLDYHTREAKPVLWNKRRLSEMTQAELVEDADTLGDLQRAIEAPFQPPRAGKLEGYTLTNYPTLPGDADVPVELRPVPLGTILLADQNEHKPFKPEGTPSWVVTYRFNPDEPFKLHVGKKYAYSPLNGVTEVQTNLGLGSEDESDDEKEQKFECEVLSVDAENGLVQIKYGPKIWKTFPGVAPEALQLLPKRKDSLIFTYHFDPQDSKLSEGDACFFAHDTSITCTIESIDYQAGVAKLLIGKSVLEKLQQNPPEKLGLIPNDWVRPDTIQASILNIVEMFLDEDNLVDGKRYLPGPVINFATHSRPRMKNDTDPNAPLVDEDLLENPAFRDRLYDAIYKVVTNLNGTTLPIQGPPGSGKTSLAAYLIVRLVKDAEAREKDDAKIDFARFGIGVPSHAAGEKLIKAVNIEKRRQGVSFEIINIDHDESEAFGEDDEVERIDSAAKADFWDGIESEEKKKGKKARLFVATAWPHSRPHFARKFEYTFIDEGSQVSAANFVGMAASSRNIVLLGDQNQLNHVSQGAQPRNSSRSALEQMANGQRILPPHIGITLRHTGRSHSKIVKVVSPIYGGKFKALAANDKQRVWRRGGDTLIRTDNGIQYDGYDPRPGEDTRQKSQREAEHVRDLWQGLIGRRFTKADGSVITLTKDDIMIITPWALHAKKIKEYLPEARIGTVHKFQGQEAPVVIFSLAISEANPFGRSIDHWGDLNMTNTALTRAQALVIIVGSRKLENIHVRTVDQIEQLSLIYRAFKEGGWEPN